MSSGLQEQDIYRIIYTYEGNTYQSVKYYRTKEKAESIAIKHEDARAVIWLKKKNREERLVYCFEVAK